MIGTWGMLVEVVVVGIVLRLNAVNPYLYYCVGSANCNNLYLITSLCPKQDDKSQSLG